MNEINFESVVKIMGEINKDLYGINPYEKIIICDMCRERKAEYKLHGDKLCNECLNDIKSRNESN